MARSGGDSLAYWASRQGASVESQLRADSLRAKLIMQRKRMQADRVDLQVPPSGNGHVPVDMTWAGSLPSCPVFTPTAEEFEDPMEYIQRIAPKASKFGICKVVSPIVTSVPAGHVLTKEKPGFKFTPRVQPMRLSNWDSTDTHKFLISGQQYSFHEYEKMATKFSTRRFGSSACLSPTFMETEFWKEINNGKINVEYGCDIEGSAFSASTNDSLGRSKWNLNNFSHLDDSTLRLLDTAIPGVTKPMLYIGMAFAMFAWHVEDHYLFSINYHHCGAPKTWYGVPGDSAPKFEKVVLDHVYHRELLDGGHEGLAYDLLIGKTTMFSPKLLVEHKVPTYRAVQNPGEFVITFPRAYHAGFSHGFNCSEAVNFTMGDWFPFGNAACTRYELLKRVPLLPHEELLCKEAVSISRAPALGMVLSKGQPHASSLRENSVKRHFSVKAAFVRFMRFQHQVRWLLRSRGAQNIYRSPGFNSSVMCVLCKHMCYLAFLTCPCVDYHPTCLNHAKEIRACKCGSQRSIVVHEQLEELEKISVLFEQEDGIWSAARRQPIVEAATFVDDRNREENMLGSEDYEGYTPLGDYSLPPGSAAQNIKSVRGHMQARLPVGCKAEDFRLTTQDVTSVEGAIYNLPPVAISHPIVKQRICTEDSDLSSGKSSGVSDCEPCDSCRRSKDHSRSCAHVSDGKVHLPAAAKRKRSLIVTKKATAPRKLHLKVKGVHAKPHHHHNDQLSEEDEDDDSDEDYWPP